MFIRSVLFGCSVKSKQNLIKKADRFFSIYVRQRGATYGYNHCFTCTAYLPWEELQAGHFISRRYQNTRWHPVNVWPQCNRCNVQLGGNLEVYEQRLVSMFSQEAVDELWELARTNDGMTDDEILDIINKYKV